MHFALPPHKSTALVIFPDIGTACLAVMKLDREVVSAAELMDVRGESREVLEQKVAQVQSLLADIPKVFPITFTGKKEEYEALWNIRKGLFPAVGNVRRIGTTVIIEDVAFPKENLAEATLDLRGIMNRHGYGDAIIFGHALDGNLHFVLTQDFSKSEEVSQYQAFMEEICTMVVQKYHGSLKAEHGTGRNMAPFVEMEWGKHAYRLMRQIKAAFDPGNLLNPGVIINDNPKIHLENLKPMPQAHEISDKRIECGFCEVMCLRKTSRPPRGSALSCCGKLPAWGGHKRRRSS